MLNDNILCPRCIHRLNCTPSHKADAAANDACKHFASGYIMDNKHETTPITRSELNNPFLYADIPGFALINKMADRVEHIRNRAMALSVSDVQLKDIFDALGEMEIYLRNVNELLKVNS